MLYENVFTSQDSKPLDRTIGLTPVTFCFSPSQECFLFTQCRRLLEKFCATNSMKKNAYHMSVGWKESQTVEEMQVDRSGKCR